MPRFMRALAIVSVVILGSFVLACDENGSGSYKSGPNANKMAGTPQITSGDREFAAKAATGGRHEVELGRLAADRASNSDVKAFADRMIKDHSQANDDLMDITKKLGISLPTEDDAAFKQTSDKLSKLKGADFDRAYMSEMLDDHMKDASEIGNYANSGNNPDLKAWATKTSTIVQDHLKMAQATAAKVGVNKPAEPK